MTKTNQQVECSFQAAQPVVPNAVVEMIEELGRAATAALLELFVDQVVETHHQLPGNEEAIDLPRLHLKAHSLKGTAACYGAQKLSETAALLDRVSYTSDCTDIRSSIEAVRLQCQRAIAEYGSLVAYYSQTFSGPPTAAITQNRPLGAQSDC